VFDVAPDIMRHRLVLSYEALAREVSADHVLARVLSTVPAPRIAPSQDRVAATSLPAMPATPAPPPPPDHLSPYAPE
jgi:MoxR-like ATPase